MLFGNNGLRECVCLTGLDKQNPLRDLGEVASLAFSTTAEPSSSVKILEALHLHLLSLCRAWAEWFSPSKVCGWTCCVPPIAGSVGNSGARGHADHKHSKIAGCSAALDRRRSGIRLGDIGETKLF